MRRSTEVAVAAPADIVWKMVSDVTRIGEWSPETQSAEWVSGEPGSVGARFRGRNRRRRWTWSTTCEVIESSPGRTFAFAVGTPAKASTVWRYELGPTREGCTVTESFELRKPLGRASRLSTRLLLGVRDREADLMEGMQHTLAALKETAERETAMPR